MTVPPQQMVREAVGVFHDRDGLLTAVDDLMNAGFDRAELSLLASEQAVQEKLGRAYDKVETLEDDSTVPRVAFVGNHSEAIGRVGLVGGLAYIGATVAAGAVVASGGALAATIAAAAIAGGGSGMLGAFAAHLLGQERARGLQHQLDRGGLLLWVHCSDRTHEERATEILTRDGGEHVHVHDLPASEDPDANPLRNLKIDPFLPGSQI